MQQQRLFEPVRRAGRRRTMIRWYERRLALRAQALAKVAYGSRREPQFSSDGRWLVALLETPKNLSPQSQR